AGQGHRRSEVGHDAEVEYEHVRDNQRYAQIQQRRSRDRAGDDVVGNGRNTHAQYQAGQHGQQQGQEEDVLTYRQDVSGKGRRHPGQGDDAGDHAHQHAGDTHRRRAARPLQQRVQAYPQGLPTAADEPAGGHQHGDDTEDHADAELEEAGADNAERYPERHPQGGGGQPQDQRRAEDHYGRQGQTHGTGEHRGAPGEQQPDQHEQGDQQEPALAHRIPGAGAFLLRQPVEL